MGESRDTLKVLALKTLLRIRDWSTRVIGRKEILLIEKG
jgi:hypothetical protein